MTNGKKDIEKISTILFKLKNTHYQEQLNKKYPTLRSIGVLMKDLRNLALSFKMNHDLALALMEQPIFEYRFLGCLIANPNKLTKELVREWLVLAQSSSIVDQALIDLIFQSKQYPFWMDEFLKDNDAHVRYGGYSLLSLYFRKEDLANINLVLSKSTLNVIRHKINQQPLTIQNAMNNAVVMAGLHVPALVTLASEVADHIGHVMPLVARNQCNIQSAKDYLIRYGQNPRYSRVAKMQKN